MIGGCLNEVEERDGMSSAGSEFWVTFFGKKVTNKLPELYKVRIGSYLKTIQNPAQLEGYFRLRRRLSRTRGNNKIPNWYD